MTDVHEVASRTGAGIGLAYRRREASPVEVIECVLDRIERSRSDHIFITVTGERALAEAAAADARYRRGNPLSALDGVPVAWKDVIDIAGAPTTAGSKLFAERSVKTCDLVCAANAAAAGMVTVGKLNMSELAYSGLGLNPHFGTPRNPNDPNNPRVPGGSSSGCGVAVAAQLVPIAIGTDTGGSVRIPAAFNGITGLKTSCGRIDKTGLFALSRTYDTIGPLARCVEDCILVDSALRGAAPMEARSTEVSCLSLLVPTNALMADVEVAVVANFQRVLDTLAASGVLIRLERVEAIDEIVQMNTRFGTLTAAEAYQEHRNIVDSGLAAQLDRRVLHRILDGKRMLPSDVLAIRQNRPRLIAKFLRQLGGALIAMPTTPLVAPAIAPLEASDELFHSVNQFTLRNTMLGNILDLCGVALPSGWDAAGMPTSILFSAACGEDDRLLSAAFTIEQLLAAGCAQ